MVEVACAGSGSHLLSASLDGLTAALAQAEVEVEEVAVLRVTINVMNHRKLRGEERLYFTRQLVNSSLREARAGTYRQDLIQRPWRVLLTRLLSMACSCCLYCTQEHLSRGGICHELGSPP